jgi:glucokinase
MILSGDVGGTSTRVAFFEREGGRLRDVARETYPSRGYPGLERILEEFLARHPGKPEGACFGIAGPVRRGSVNTTNLAWVVESESLARTLSLEGVHLLNDLEANAYGIPDLAPEALSEVHPGAPGAAGNAALISAGTGLGEAGLYWDGSSHRPFATEGGHAGFAPADERETELLRYLRRRLGHVSCERVVSGPGLVNIYEFLRDSGHGDEPAWLAEEIRSGDPSAAISEAGVTGRSELCALALDLFISAYGSEAGNLALKTLATGGVYVGGGIAPKILPKLKEGRFVEAFAAKGRFEGLLRDVPIRVILDPDTALRGAARYASLFLEKSPNRR